MVPLQPWKSPIISPDLESRTTTNSRLRIVRDFADKTGKLPSHLNMYLALTCLSRPLSVPDSKMFPEKGGYVSSVSRRRSGFRETLHRSRLPSRILFSGFSIDALGLLKLDKLRIFSMAIFSVERFASPRRSCLPLWREAPLLSHEPASRPL